MDDLQLLMRVGDVFTQPGVGTVVTGYVSGDTFSVGDELLIFNPNNDQWDVLKCKGIEKDGKLYNQARHGDVVGILFEETSIERGSAICILPFKFLLKVDDIYHTKSGLGTVVTGVVLYGELHKGDLISIKGKYQHVEGRAIEANGKIIDYAKINDAISILLPKTNLSKGDILFIPKDVVIASGKIDSTPQPVIHEDHVGSSIRRLALVIGNVAYKDGPLRNCVNDAVAFANKLHSQGVDIIACNDADKPTMDNAVARFCSRAADYDVAIFFFSGHGLQLNGKTWLMPTDYPSGNYMETSSLCVDDILNRLNASSCPIKVLILDSCRSIPRDVNVARFKGISETNAKGVFVAYSTGPGQVAQDGFGKHSPFMEAILATMNDGRMPIYDFFKRVAKKVSILSSGSQTPWIEDCLTSTDVTLF